MAAVAGNVNQPVPVQRQLTNAFAAADVDALINFAPGPADNAVGQADHLIREVGRNLFHQLNGVLLRFFLRNLLAARFVFYRLGDSLRLQQLIKQIVTHRQTRADCGQALTGEMDARHARELLRDGFIGAVFGGHAAQRYHWREANKAVASQPEDGKKLLHSVELAQMRRLFALHFASRRTAEHHGYRHHLHIQIGIVAVQVEVVVKQLHRLLIRHEVGENARPVMDKHMTRQQGAVDLQRLQRIGQIVQAALGAQRQKIGL